MSQIRITMRLVAISGAAALMALSISTPALAKWDWATGPSKYDEEGKRSWGVEVVPYFWLASLSGRMSIPDVDGSLPVEADFSNLASNLDAGLAGLIDLRFRRWHLMSDNSWVRLQINEDQVVGPAAFSASLTPEVAFGTVAVAYELPLVERFALDVYLAARWWHVKAAATIVGTITGPGPGPPTRFAGSVSGTETWANAIVGFRARYQITDRWRVSAAADIGGGQADLDWSAFASVGYDINRHVGLTLAYRILGVDYSNQGFVYDMKQSGLLLGLNLRY